MGKSRFWSEKHEFDVAILEMFDSDVVPGAVIASIVCAGGLLLLLFIVGLSASFTI
jgi:hypothetical protein